MYANWINIYTSCSHFHAFGPWFSRPGLFTVRLEIPEEEAEFPVEATKSSRTRAIRSVLQFADRMQIVLCQVFRDTMKRRVSWMLWCPSAPLHFSSFSKKFSNFPARIRIRSGDITDRRFRTCEIEARLMDRIFARFTNVLQCEYYISQERNFAGQTRELVELSKHVELVIRRALLT